MPSPKAQAPAGTDPLPEKPVLANLREREKAKVEKRAFLDTVDANEYLRQGFDVREMKQRADAEIVALRKEIAKHAK